MVSTQQSLWKPGGRVNVLRGHKVPYAHPSRTVDLPRWMGGDARVDSISQWGRGDMKARYIRDGGDALGVFKAVSIAVSPPSASPASLFVKESVGEFLYAWGGPIDLDVRYQSSGRVDDPMNWVMIKRMCECLITDMSTSGETSYSPHDEGETIVKAQLTSPNAPMIIYQLVGIMEDLYNDTMFATYDHDPVVAAFGDHLYVMPVASGSAYAAAIGTDKKDVSVGKPLLPQHIISLASRDNIVIAVLEDGSVYWSHDNGLTFSQSTGMGTYTSVVAAWSYSNIMVGSYDTIRNVGSVYKSTDGGRTFQSADPYGAVSGGVLSIVYRDDKTVYVLDSNGTISMSDDGGESFIRAGAAPVNNPTSMIIMGDVLIVGGYALTVPVVVGSLDGGFVWTTLVSLPGCDPSIGRILLCAEACGVVDMSAVYSDGTYMHSEIYRNVNWGAYGAWELIWQDIKSAADYSNLMIITSLASACVNDLLCMGRIAGQVPLYAGIKFMSEV